MLFNLPPGINSSYQKFIYILNVDSFKKVFHCQYRAFEQSLSLSSTYGDKCTLPPPIGQSQLEYVLSRPESLATVYERLSLAGYAIEEHGGSKYHCVSFQQLGIY